jgi:hypothetical protein
MRTDQSTLNQVLGKDKGRQQLHVREDEVETSSKRQVETSVGEISKSESVRMQDVKGGVELNAASSRGMDKSNAIGGGGGCKVIELRTFWCVVDAKVLPILQKIVGSLGWGIGLEEIISNMEEVW